MAVLQIALMVFGIALFVVGYRKTHRNRMLIGTVLIVLAFALPDFVTGFSEGFTEGYNDGQVTPSAR
ncbi:hypothetical protein GCM10028794_09770 [Silanimonas algicola]